MPGDLELHNIYKELPTLLIIDDFEEIVNFISEFFSEEYNCLTAEDGVGGIAVAESSLPDIILCDVRMPKMSGLEVVNTLKKNPLTRYIPIILLSGYNTRENRLEGLRAMADDFLAKPLDYEELRIKMANLLKKRKEFLKKEPKDYLKNEIGIDTQGYNPDERHFLEAMVDHLANYYSNKKLDVENIAHHMEISVRQLQRKIKAITGIPPMDLLRIYRLRQSAQLLVRHNSIAEVSEACGFRSPNYYCTCFKDYYNITPSAYQKNK